MAIHKQKAALNLQLCQLTGLACKDKRDNHSVYLQCFSVNSRKFTGFIENLRDIRIKFYHLFSLEFSDLIKMSIICFWCACTLLFDFSSVLSLFFKFFFKQHISTNFKLSLLLSLAMSIYFFSKFCLPNEEFKLRLMSARFPKISISLLLFSHHFSSGSLCG